MNLIVTLSDDASRNAAIELGTRSNLITLKAFAILREIYFLYFSGLVFFMVSNFVVPLRYANVNDLKHSII